VWFQSPVNSGRRAISDAVRREFRRMPGCTAARYGREIIAVDCWFPSFDRACGRIARHVDVRR